MTENQQTPSSYVPGYAAAKRALLAGGLLLIAIAFAVAWRPLHLVFTGDRASAEVARIIIEKPGVPSETVTDTATLTARQTLSDRSYTFWNEFRFQTKARETIEVRAHVGSQLKPLYPLVDADGLPTADTVFYDPDSPRNIVFPFVISTWLMPVIIFLLGLLGAIFGGVLLFWARRPIELPILPPPRS